jgi:3'(2'), 5'-bisphosphate nucleotidase
MSVDRLWAVLEESLPPVFADYRSRLADLPVEVKADRTLLTEADLRIQELILSAIRTQEPGAVIIAEEDERIGFRAEVAESHGRVWIIDPIDGTAQFVRHDQVEFCSVVCLLEGWQPAQAFVLAPELGIDRNRLLVTVDTSSQSVFVDGTKVHLNPIQNHPRWLSLTRSADEPARPIEAVAADHGYRAKTRTTSQSKHSAPRDGWKGFR